MNEQQRLLAALTLILQKCQPEPTAKLLTALEDLKKDFTRKQFFYLFAICPRWFNKTIPVDCEELKEFDRFGLMSNWFSFQFARLVILVDICQAIEDSEYENVLNALFDTADVNELVLLVQSLSFLTERQRFVDRAREAARSNIVDVFCAVAHDNNYAQTWFDLEGWNQLILKAAFLAVPLWSIHGLLERNNSELVIMLKHYVWERQTAKRDVPWDIWRCIAQRAKSEEELDYLQMQYYTLDDKSRGAILLALNENESEAAVSLLNILSVDFSLGDVRELTWSALSKCE